MLRLCFGHGKSSIPLSSLVYNRLLLNPIGLLLYPFLLENVCLELLICGLARELLFVTDGVTLEDNSLFIVLSQLISQLLHLHDRIGLLFALLTHWKVPKYILVVVRAIYFAPKVEPVRPDSHLAVL